LCLLWFIRRRPFLYLNHNGGYKVLKIGIIGAGTVGTALAVKLSSKGYTIAAVNSRSRSSTQRLIDQTGSGQIYDSPQ
jgi:predicted short-subunit dehydrogenase-like oxidoreductase (DUF2520 family)